MHEYRVAQVQRDGPRAQPLAEVAGGREGARACPSAAKVRIIGLVHVAEVAEDVHRVVVAKQVVHLAALRRRLLREPPEELVDLLGLAAAVDNVASLHEHRVAARPAAVGVHETGELEHAHGRAQVAVQVGHGHQPPRRAAAPRRTTGQQH